MGGNDHPAVRGGRGHGRDTASRGENGQNDKKMCGPGPVHKKRGPDPEDQHISSGSVVVIKRAGIQ